MSDTKPTDPQSNLLPPERTPPSGPVPPAEAQADAAGEAAGDTLVFPSIVGLELGFNAAEDRVVMLARTHQSEIRVILLTRRMMGQLLGHYADLMRRTSPAVARAPSAHQNEVLQMEQVSALMSAAPQQPISTPVSGPGSAPGSAPGSGQAATVADAPRSFHLVTEIRMQVNDSHLSLGFIGPQQSFTATSEAPTAPIAAATMDRAEAHRFLAMLNDKAVEAGWGLEGICPWLTSAGLAPSAQLQVN